MSLRCGGREVSGRLYWSTLGGADTPAVVAQWATRIPLLHIKDGPLVEGEPHQAVGQGKVAVRPIIEAANDDTLEWLIVELDACGTDMTEAVGASIRYLVDEGLGLGKA